MSLDVRRDGAATWITLDRPDALNALDGTVREALVDALGEAAGDPGVRAVALTGSGRAFCVGQDLRELEQGYREGRAPDLAAVLERHYAPICRLLAEMPKPTVAVVNGVAAGAGVSLALALSGRFAALAAVSAISRLVVYVFTCAATLRLRSPRFATSVPPAVLTVPFGPFIPALAIVIGLAILAGATPQQRKAGALALLAGAALYVVARIAPSPGRPRAASEPV